MIYRSVELTIYRGATKVVKLYGCGQGTGEKGLQGAVEDAFTAMVRTKEEFPRKGDRVVCLDEDTNKVTEWVLDRDIDLRLPTKT